MYNKVTSLWLSFNCWVKQNNSLCIYRHYCSFVWVLTCFVTDGLEMGFNEPFLQGAEQAQSPEVLPRERTHQLSKNSVRELLSPSPGSSSCLCDLHEQFSQLHVQTAFICKCYMRFCSWSVAKTLHAANCRQISTGLSNMSCADRQANHCAAFSTFMCKIVICSAMLPTSQREQEQGGALGDIKEWSFAVASLALSFLSLCGKRLQQQVQVWWCLTL